MQWTITLLAIGTGGALGSISRYVLSDWINREFGREFPHGLIVVNVLGCLAIGALAAFFQKESLSSHMLSPYLKSLFMIGYLGGFTTFSSFSLDALSLFNRGELFKAASYVIVSIFLSLLAVSIGFYTVQKFTSSGV